MLSVLSVCPEIGQLSDGGLAVWCRKGSTNRCGWSFNAALALVLFLANPNPAMDTLLLSQLDPVEMPIHTGDGGGGGVIMLILDLNCCLQKESTLTTP